MKKHVHYKNLLTKLRIGIPFKNVLYEYFQNVQNTVPYAIMRQNAMNVHKGTTWMRMVYVTVSNPNLPCNPMQFKSCKASHNQQL